MSRARGAAARRRALRLCLWESASSQLWVTLTGGAFLVGFAVALGCGPVLVGWLAAIPFLAQSAQILGAWITERFGQRKRSTLILIGAGRAIWLLLVPVAFLGPSRGARLLTLAVIALGSVLALAGAVPWMSWLGDLVPRQVRGRFIARRQQIIGGLTVAGSLGGGWLVDTLTSSAGIGMAFAALYGIAGLAALISEGILAAQPDPRPSPASGYGLRRGLGQTLRHPGFRSILGSMLLWNVAIGVSAPFFALYMFRELEMSFTQVALHSAIVAVTALAANPLWGSAVDRFGVRPVLLVNAFAIVLIPLLWFLPAPGFLWPIWCEAVYAGVVWTGFNLAAFSLPFAVTPSHGRAWFLAFLSLATGLGYGLASVGGGALGGALSDLRWMAPWGSPILSYHVMFALSAVLRLAGAVRMRSVREPGARATGAMIQVIGYGVLKRLSLGRQIFLAPEEPGNATGATSREG